MLESNSQVSCSKNVPKTNKVADVAVASLGPTQELEERHFTIDPPLPKVGNFAFVVENFF